MLKNIIICSLLLIALVNAKDCLKEDKGFSSGVAIFSVNGVSNGQNGPATFVEFSQITIDYVGQQLFTDYWITEDMKQFQGALYAYNSNQTIYIVANGQCSQQPLSFDIPSGIPKNFTDIGKVKIGKFDTRGLEYNNTAQGYNSVVLYDDVKCAVVSISTENLDLNNPGYTLANYYDFKDTPKYSDFQLPEICYNSGSSSDAKFEIKTNTYQQQSESSAIKLPHVLDFLPKRHN
ncbi:hypothetical protein DLAC_05419 [Tieghemostelium lacteum]|uniref:Uncharacterized protein n=1 Tax=Tieghemostelium lacteum TaxID=361077 RepID=A0A151ZFX5_TIELA|nr:hypothetical protein DLAC_05419 [Tieghemostelium lacteum]|eukprot:KYQ92835.1 hypothetical protein DLAC_05419 [Tieghemostelium lacteum]